MKSSHSLLLAGVALWCVPIVANAQSAAPVVKVANGEVSGAVEDGIASWKGVPFAAAPVGPLRWRAPQPAANWNGVRSATQYSAD